ncbi:sugar phosphate nucleotidyltransferase [Lentisphaerota bacterium WC36G]|nr:nucleotidyltransferase [Lentisphaerae bacterium WC36]
MDITLLVLAAGMGSRYGGLKQLDQVGPNGESIIDYSVFDAIRSGFTKIVFIIRKDIEDAFKEHVGSRYSDKIAVEYAFQAIDDLPIPFTVPEGRTKPWGTGQALLAAKDVVKEPFAAINADDFYGKNAFKYTADQLKKLTDNNVADFCMCGFDLNKTLSDFGSVSRGICSINVDGYLTDVTELTKIEKLADGTVVNSAEGEAISKLTGEEVVSMNMWGFTPKIFDYLTDMFTSFLEKQGTEQKSEFFLPFAVDELIKSNQATVKVLNSHDNWFGVTYSEDKDIVVENIKELIAAGVYPEKLF